MRIVPPDTKFRFPFEKYVKRILSVMPPNDLVGISEIRFVDSFSHPKSDKESLASYFQGENGKNAYIELHLGNIVKSHTPDYLLDLHFEIAALYLSEIIAHEIGHHAHTFRRHGVRKKKHEKFADDYAKAGYYHYLNSRFDKILSSYKWGSYIYFFYEKKVRKGFAKGRKDIIEWLKTNKNGIPFP